MSEFDLLKLAAIDETVSHFFFPSLALQQRRYRSSNDSQDEGISSDPNYIDPEEVEPIRIPDTVLYSYSKPIVWFYYDEQAQRVMKRPQKMLNTMSILEHFVEASRSKVGVRAWYIYPQEEELITPQTSDFLVDIASQDEIGHTGLLRFLQSPKGKGILQHYIDNKTESDGTMKNVYIQCNYSATHFSTDMFVSQKPLALVQNDNTRKKKKGGGGDSLASGAAGAGGNAISRANRSLGLRFSPYSSTYIRKPLVSSVMMTRLQNVCKSIASRLQKMLQYTVATMQVVCRIDCDDKLYVLWCGSLRLHSLNRYPDLSFWLTPQGTKHEPYSLLDRYKHSAATGDGAPIPAALQASSSPARGKKKNRDKKKSDASDSDDEAEESKREQIVLRLLSNLATPLAHDANQGKQFPNNSNGGALSSPVAMESSDGKVVTLAVSSQAAKTESTAAAVAAFEMLRCCLCHKDCRRGSLVKVQLQWVLFCLSSMDVVSSGWDCEHDVPPSVALVCPQLSKAQFDRMVALDKQRRWLQTNVGVCVDCVSDCNRANDTLCRNRFVAPDWLGIDTSFKPSAKVQARTTSLADSKNSENNMSIAEMLTYYHYSRDNEADSESPALQQLKQMVPKPSATAAVATHSKCVDDGWTGRTAISFVGATRENPEAADLYRLDREGVWKRVGFGKPSVNTRFVPPTPKIFACSLLKEGEPELMSRLECLVALSDEERRESLRCCNPLRHEESPAVPCHTPL